MHEEILELFDKPGMLHLLVSLSNRDNFLYGWLGSPQKDPRKDFFLKNFDKIKIARNTKFIDNFSLRNSFINFFEKLAKHPNKKAFIKSFFNNNKNPLSDDFLKFLKWYLAELVPLAEIWHSVFQTHFQIELDVLAESISLPGVLDLLINIRASNKNELFKKWVKENKWVTLQIEGFNRDLNTIITKHPSHYKNIFDKFDEALQSSSSPTSFYEKFLKPLSEFPLTLERDFIYELAQMIEYGLPNFAVAWSQILEKNLLNEEKAELGLNENSTWHQFYQFRDFHQKSTEITQDEAILAGEYDEENIGYHLPQPTDKENKHVNHDKRLNDREHYCIASDADAALLANLFAEIAKWENLPSRDQVSVQFSIRTDPTKNYAYIVSPHHDNVIYLKLPADKSVIGMKIQQAKKAEKKDDANFAHNCSLANDILDYGYLCREKMKKLRNYSVIISHAREEIKISQKDFSKIISRLKGTNQPITISNILKDEMILKLKNEKNIVNKVLTSDNILGPSNRDNLQLAACRP